MRFFLFFPVLLIGTVLFAQTDPSVKIVKAKDIPIDTLNTDPEINTIDNEIIIYDPSNENIPLLEADSSQTAEIPAVQIPVFDIHDNPEMAAIDAKWMDIVKFYDQFDPSSLYVANLPSENVAVEDLTTDILKKRLAALDAKTPFNIAYNPELERLIRSFLKTRSKTFSNLLSKAKYYFPIFEEKLDLYDVPLEMKYLAIVESALQPKARSRVGATGIWQFMYGTGKQYGLDVTSYVDERQDPILSSEAAAKHLSDLYDIFEDWDLALAAYNSGSGNVNKAIRRAGGKKNYWNIRPYLPRETASYVPIFYATLYLCEYSSSHHIFPDDQFNLNHFEVDTLNVKRTISFDQINKTTGIDISLLEFLNPVYKLNIIPYEEGKPYALVLPKEYVGKFVQNEDLIYAYVAEEAAKREKPLPENLVVNPSESKTIYHRVKSGEVLGKIAERYGVSVKNIMKWNHLKSSRIHVGQKLKIYKNGGGAVSSASADGDSSASKTQTITYVVRSGDSLLKISKKYHVSVDDIKKWNHLKSDKINVGAKLKIIKG